jgi:hypothetical protein
MARRREVEVFSLSFLDAICCGFGAVIMLLVLNKAAEPRIIEQARVDRRELVAALQEELARIRGETTVLDREMTTVEAQLARDRELLARLQADLSRIRGRFAASPLPGIDADETGELLAARQRLTEEMRRLLADYRPPDKDAPVGGIPVDSEYIVFVIDTSGSMFQGPWRLVLRKVSETLRVYPKVRGIQVMNDEGKYMFSSYAGKWIPDSPGTRQRIIDTLATWNPYSDSSPVEGIAEAINTFYEPGKPMSVFVFGDDFPTGQVEAVARYVERVNRADEFGNRLVRIHGVGFPTQIAGGRMGNALRFANLMRALCERNGGTFVALATLN